MKDWVQQHRRYIESNTRQLDTYCTFYETRTAKTSISAKLNSKTSPWQKFVRIITNHLPIFFSLLVNRGCSPCFSSNPEYVTNILDFWENSVSMLQIALRGLENAPYKTSCRCIEMGSVRDWWENPCRLVQRCINESKGKKEKGIFKLH